MFKLVMGLLGIIMGSFPSASGAGDSPQPENIVITTESSGGLGFAIFRGHDLNSMKNTAWQTLFQRGVEWAASGKFTILPAKDWPVNKEDAKRMAN